MGKFLLKKTAVAAMSAVLATGLVPVNVLAENNTGEGSVLGSENAGGYELVWSDEFDGESLNTGDWNVETHEPGWVNSELQRYTSLDEGNIEVSDGTLKIKPHIEVPGGSEAETSDAENNENEEAENDSDDNGSTQSSTSENNASQDNTSASNSSEEGDASEDEELTQEAVTTNVAFDVTVGEDMPESETIAVQVNFGKIDESEEGTAAAQVSLFDISLTDEEENELLSDTSFENAGENWSCNIADPAKGSSSFGDGKAYITIDESGEANWNIQLQQGGIHFEPGKSYKFSMNATSTSDRKVEVSLLDPENGYKWYGGSTQTIAGSKVVSEDTDKQDETETEESTQGESGENTSGNYEDVSAKDISFDISVGGDKAESSTIALQVNFGNIDGSPEGTAAANVVLSDISLKDEEGNELLENTSFANGGEGWSCGITDPAKGSSSFSNGKAYINIEKSGDANWNIQLQQGGIHLVPGKNYKFSMNATSNVSRKTEISLLDPDNGYDWYGGSTATISGSGSTGSESGSEGGYGEITSGRITTQNKHDFTYGRFEARAKVPAGEGYLPAFWLMATDEGNYGQWPKCGEIDIMEVMGQNTSKSYHTIHYGYDSGSGHKENQGTKTASGADFAEEFHVYRVDWDPGKITWYVDDEKVYETSDWYTGTDDDNQITYPAPFDQDFYVILNLAVGGSWVGYPTDEVKAQMNDGRAYEIDYVRVYQKSAQEYERLEKEARKPEKVVSYREADESGNYVINGDFQTEISLDGAADADMDNWLFHTENDVTGAKYSLSENGITISADTAGKQTYSVQLKQQNIPMYKGWEYELTFDAYAAEERDIVVDIEGPDRGWIRYLDDKTVTIGTEKETYTLDFTMNEKNDPNGSLEFNLGKQASTADVTITNVRLVHKSGEEIKDDGAKVIRPDGNYIYNGSFDQGENRLGYWEIQDEDKEFVSVTNKNGVRELKVVVPEGGKTVKVRQSDLSPIGKGDYSLTFNARCEDEASKNSLTLNVAGHEYTPELGVSDGNYSEKIHFDNDNSRENSFVEILFKNQGTYYIDNLFLTESALIRNGSFNAGIAGFSPYIDGAAKANYVIDNMNGNDNTFAITIEDTGANVSNDWYIQLNQDGITLEEGKSYRLSFRAKSSMERQIKYCLQQFEGDWTNYSGTPEPVTVNDKWKVFTAEFRMNNATDAATRFNITMGSIGGERIQDKHDIYIDDITLVELDEDVEETKTTESEYTGETVIDPVTPTPGDSGTVAPEPEPEPEPEPQPQPEPVKPVPAPVVKAVKTVQKVVKAVTKTVVKVVASVVKSIFRLFR